MQDFATFLTYGRGGRWSSKGAAANGGFTHFIVYNEVPWLRRVQAQNILVYML